MALIDDFLPDFDATFKNPQEFGETREFMFVNKVFVADVVWDRDHMKSRFIVQQQGVFIGDVMLFIPMWYFKQGDELVPPKPDEILYSPKEIGWIVSQITEAGEVYEIALTKLLV